MTCEEERETERDRRLSVEKARTYSTTRRHNSLHMRSTLTKHMIACFQLFTVYPLPAVRQLAFLGILIIFSAHPILLCWLLGYSAALV
jgi:hypothetical protein